MSILIVSYHYVHDPGEHAYNVNTISVRAFRKQLEELLVKYRMIRVDDLLTPSAIPDNAALLTFDDGYRDHYANVCPVLKEYGIQGAFFPSARTLVEGCLLDTNKIQIMVSKDNQIDSIIATVEELSHAYGLEYQRLKAKAGNYSGMFDGKKVVFIKRFLMRVIPPNIREQFIDDLFRQVYGGHQKEIARDMYLTDAQLAEMKETGMHIGSHGYDHIWLQDCPRAEQERQIESAMQALCGLLSSPMCVSYPYGSYNSETLDIVKTKGFVFGFTATPGQAELRYNNHLALPRCDTKIL